MSVTLVILNNPFDHSDRTIRTVDVGLGRTLRAFLEEHAPAGEEQEYHASINGRVYGPEELDAQIVHPGDFVAVCPVLRGGGGGGGKNPLAILASVALAMFSFGMVAPAVSGMFGGSAIAGQLAAGATLMIGGQLLSNALGPKMKSGDDEESYRWGALQPINNQGAVIPITYGTIRTAGQIVNQHIRVEDDIQHMELLLCGGEGPIDEFSDIRVNDNPLENYEHAFHDTRPGSNNQTPIEGFEKLYDNQFVGFTLEVGDGPDGKPNKTVPGAWMIHEVEGDALDYIEVTLDFPEGMGWFPETRSGPEKHWVEPEFQYSRRNSDGSWGGWISWFKERFEGATTKPFTRVRTTPKLMSGKYRVRGRMFAKDGVHPTKDRNRTIWTSMTAVVEEPMVHPGKALLGVRIQATNQISGGMPVVTWRQTRKTVWVKDGASWVKKDARNPAWIIYDLCVRARDLDGTIHVFGEKPERMDLPVFKAWAQWNDRQINNRPALKMNLLVDESKNLWDWVNDIARSARGAVVLKGTKISCIWDQPSEPVQLFTMGNILAGSFSGEFLPMEGRANAVEISFLNEAKNFEREQITVYADGFDTMDGPANPVSIQLVGITSFEQAWREGLYQLNQNKYILRTITFSADVDAIACQVGDVILVQHDVPQWGQGGRILSVSGNTLKLDRTVTLNTGVSYRILVRKQGDTLIERSVSSGAGGETDTVQVSDSGGLSAYDVFTIGEVNKVAKPFRIREMSRDGDLHVTMTCTEYIPELYTESGIIPEIDYSEGVNRIANLRLAPSGYYSSTGQWVAELWATWSYRGKKPIAYEVEWKQDQGVWGGRIKTSETTAQCPLRETTSLYSVRVRGLYAGLPPSEWAYATSEGIVLGNGIPPDPPTDLKAEGWFGFASLTWKNPQNVDLSHIEVWEAMEDDRSKAVMVGQTRADSYTRLLPAGGTTWYWVRAVNHTGQKSEFNAEAGTPCIIAPNSHEDYIEDLLKRNPWLKDQIDELQKQIDPIYNNVQEIMDKHFPDIEGRIKDAEDRIRDNIAPALDSVSEGVMRLSDEANRSRNVFRWAGIEVNEQEGTVTLRAVEDLKTATGYQFSDVRQELNAQKASINLKASRTYVDELAASLISSVVVAKEWQFKGSLHGWTAQNATLTAQPAGMLYATTGTEPSLTSPDIEIDGSKNNIVSLQLQQVSGDISAFCKVQYKTAQHGYSDAHMKRVPILGSINTSRAVQVNMNALDAGGDGWKTSTITGLRICLGDSAGKEYQVTLVNIGQSSLNDLLMKDLEMRVTQAEADIDGANAAIRLKADETTVKGLAQELKSAGIDIDALKAAMTLKAEKTELNGIEARVSNAEIAINALDGGIIQQVLDFSGMQGQLDDLSAASLQNSANEAAGQEQRRVALAKAREELYAKVEDTNRAVARYNLELLAVMNNNSAVYDKKIEAVATDVSAEVQAREQLEARVTTQTGDLYTRVQQEAIARANADGQLFAKYSIKTDVNGYVAGYALNNGGNNHSSFIVSVDHFMVVKPGYTSPRQIMAYDSSSGSLHLQNLYVDGAWIKNATIDSAKIRNATIDRLKIRGRSLTATAQNQSEYEITEDPPVIWTSNQPGLYITVEAEAGTPTDILMVTGLDCAGDSIDLRLRRGGTLLALVRYFRNNTVNRISATYAFRDRPPTGTHTYYIDFRYSGGASGGGRFIRTWSRAIMATSIFR